MPDTATAATKLPRSLEDLNDELARVEQWMEEQLRGDHPRLNPLLDHVRRFRGKRLRAAQVLLIGKACGRLTEEHVAVAGIIELIHLATLVHDDLLDESLQRRGLSCVHVEWGAHAAVLLGDWIYAQAFRRSTELRDRECSRVLAEATRQICSGEIHQNLTRGEFELSEADYLHQIDGKTAALYRAGGQLAAHYAGASETVQQACARHGLLAGRAFQIADDLLDLVGEEERVGKSLGTDWARGKLTLPILRLRDALDGEARARLAADFGSGVTRESLLSGEFGERLKGIVEQCRREVREWLAEAANSLNELAAGPARDSLMELTLFLGDRKR